MRQLVPVTTHGLGGVLVGLPAAQSWVDERRSDSLNGSFPNGDRIEMELSVGGLFRSFHWEADTRRASVDWTNHNEHEACQSLPDRPVTLRQRSRARHTSP